MRRDDPTGLTPVLPVLAIEAGARYLPATRVHLRDWARRRGPAIQRLLPSMMQNGLAHFHMAPGMDIEALSCAGVQRLRFVTESTEIGGRSQRTRPAPMMVSVFKPVIRYAFSPPALSACTAGACAGRGCRAPSASRRRPRRRS